MFSLFAPPYIKEAQLVLKNARKLLHYKKDLLPEASRADFQATMDRLEGAIRGRYRAGVEDAAEKLDAQWSRYLPPTADAGWRENCEVFLVAIVIAIGVRTFFLQPFTIPTGSMQPTLNGIIGTPTEAPAPAIPGQVFDFLMRGRNYLNVTAKSDDMVVSMAERKMLFFLTFTGVQCSHSSYTIWAPLETLQRSFGVVPGRQYHAGDSIARGYVDAGDHVFVDKLSYNLHTPTRGEVFVFSTRGIPRIQDELNRQGVEGSEFYIKRLAGLPLDTLRIQAPLLFVNGREAQEFGLQRVMSATGSYGGYTNPTQFDPMANPGGALYLTAPDATFTVPSGHFFAMGDNSGNSFDSRYWGPVPQDNLMGRGLFVYWPFLPHWGFVK
jgi:signal peptidase I